MKTRPNPALPTEYDRAPRWMRWVARKLEREGWTVIPPTVMERARTLDLDMSGFPDCEFDHPHPGHPCGTHIDGRESE